LEATESLRVGLNLGLTPAEYQRLRDRLVRFEADCEELAAYHLPETITHEEVHENNVLLGNSFLKLLDTWLDLIAIYW
jgi:hypothetical protein